MSKNRTVKDVINEQIDIYNKYGKSLIIYICNRTNNRIIDSHFIDMGIEAFDDYFDLIVKKVEYFSESVKIYF